MRSAIPDSAMRPVVIVLLVYPVKKHHHRQVVQNQSFRVGKVPMPHFTCFSGGDTIHMALKRTNIYLDDTANKTLRSISKRLGLAPAQLTRLAISQFIQREAVQKSKAASA